MTKIIISPHFDDAVFSLGGYLSLDPQNTLVITVFGGKPNRPLKRWWDIFCGFKDSDIAIQTRTQENKKALSSLGIPDDNIINLQFNELQYRSFFETKREIEEMTNSVGEEIEKIIDKQSGEIHLYSPSAPIHRDHRITKIAIASLFKNGNMSKFILHFYQDMPYTYEMLRTKSIRKLKNFKFDSYKPRLEKSVDLKLEREITPLSDGVMRQKILASNFYSTQFSFLFKYILGLIEKFNYYQARYYDQSEKYAEVTYVVQKTNL